MTDIGYTLGYAYAESSGQPFGYQRLTATLVYVNAVGVAPRPTTKTIFGNVSKIVGVAPRPQTKTVFGYSARAAATAPRPTARVFADLRLPKVILGEGQKAETQSFGQFASYQRVLLDFANIVAAAPRPIVKARLAFPLKLDVRGVAPFPVVRAVLRVPVGVRATFGLGAMSMAAKLFMPPFKVEAKGINFGPLSMSGSLAVPVFIDSHVSFKRMKMSGAVQQTIQLDGAISFPPMSMRGELMYSPMIDAAMSFLPLEMLGAIKQNLPTIDAAMSLGMMELAGHLDMPVSLTGAMMLGAMEMAGRLEQPFTLTGTMGLQPIKMKARLVQARQPGEGGGFTMQVLGNRRRILTINFGG